MAGITRARVAQLQGKLRTLKEPERFRRLAGLIVQFLDPDEEPISLGLKAAMQAAEAIYAGRCFGLLVFGIGPDVLSRDEFELVIGGFVSNVKS